MLIERLPTLSTEELMVFAGIPTDQLLHTRAAQGLLDRGGTRGRHEDVKKAKRKARPVDGPLRLLLSPCAYSTAAAAHSARPPPLAFRPCHWSSWRAWPRRYSISVAQPTSRPGWKSTRAECRSTAGAAVGNGPRSFASTFRLACGTGVPRRQESSRLCF